MYFNRNPFKTKAFKRPQNPRRIDTMTSDSILDRGGRGGHSPPIELPLFSKFGFKDYLEAPSGNRTQDWLITILSDQNYASTQNSIFSKYFNSWISEGHLNKDNYSLSQRFR